jgi:hypothetical protein
MDTCQNPEAYNPSRHDSENQLTDGAIGVLPLGGRPNSKGWTSDPLVSQRMHRMRAKP